MNGWQVWGRRLQRALSLRVGCMTLVLAVVAGALVGLAWPAAAVPVTFGVWGLGWLGYVFSDNQMLGCDACGKMVKLGASTCHHCGYVRA